MATLAQINVMQEGVLFGLPMPLTFKPPVAMSDDDLIAFSRRNEPYQIERNSDGELEVMTPPGAQGSRWEAIAISQLSQWAELNGGVTFSSNSGFILRDGSMRGPDSAWISDAHWNALTKAQRERFLPVPPDFLIEILSRTDSIKRLEAKMRMWIDNGVQLAWMIDPYKETVSIYRAGAELEVLSRPESVEAGEPVAGFRLLLHRIWDK